jgi:hypothetical protein
METSKEIIQQAKDRFKELEHKKLDWRSFYNGFLEAKVKNLASSGTGCSFYTLEEWGQGSQNRGLLGTYKTREEAENYSNKNYMRCFYANLKQISRKEVDILTDDYLNDYFS